jgi:hypothetical protein
MSEEGTATREGPNRRTRGPTTGPAPEGHQLLLNAKQKNQDGQQLMGLTGGAARQRGIRPVEAPG